MATHEMSLSSYAMMPFLIVIIPITFRPFPTTPDYLPTTPEHSFTFQKLIYGFLPQSDLLITSYLSKIEHSCPQKLLKLVSDS